MIDLFMLQSGRFSVSFDGSTSILAVKRTRLCDNGPVGVFIKNSHGDAESITRLTVYSITSLEDLHAGLQHTSKGQ